MKVAIIGYRVEGQANAAYWQAQGAEITVCDQDTTVKDDSKPYSWQLGEDYLNNLGDFDLIVRTAGIHPKKIIEANSNHPDLQGRITTSVNELLNASPTKNIIGVTGTKGKGTTSTLIAKMLESSGKTVHLSGNIGIAPLETLPKLKADDWLVLELSSFQLIDIKKAPRIAVCLMVVPEHLDWHTNLDEYITAKENLFKLQMPGDLTVFNARNSLSQQITHASLAKKLAYDVPPAEQAAHSTEAGHVSDETIFFGETAICKTSETGLLGRHNLENICAAISAVWEASGSNAAAIKKVIQDFKGLEHRIEFIKEVDGVKYYNDSFSTTPETSIAAMRAFEQSKVVIVGGSDKGIPFDNLAQEIIEGNTREAIVIGKTGEAIATLLQKSGFERFTRLEHPSVKEIVDTARSKAMSGDVVILSPGSASFDMFKDYKDRGEQFKKAVLDLPES